MFDVVELPDDLAERGFEVLGSRDKRWVELEGALWLFKWSTGTRVDEDWAEVLASACAERLGLPHAEYRLAVSAGRRGVLSRKFHSADYDLVLGNQLLVEQDPVYPMSSGSRYERTPQHTLAAVAAVLDQSPRLALPLDWQPAEAMRSAADVFAGYLLLDAWVGNTDRHHMNWGVVRRQVDQQRHLAPTFDHASSLGAHLSDGERRGRLTTRDKGYAVAAYVQGARSALYSDPASPRSLGTLDAVQGWRCHAPGGMSFWRGQLERIDETEAAMLTERIPATHASEAARRFAAEVLQCNRRRILDEVTT